MNDLKRLITPEELQNLKNASLALDKYSKDILIPFKDTVSAEIRRYINIHRKIEIAIKETEKLMVSIKI